MGRMSHGLRVVLTEELDWLGGQLTAQGVPPDEHPWIESVATSQNYAELRRAIRDYYREHMPLTDAARSSLRLNPGGGNVSACSRRGCKQEGYDF